MKNIDLLFDTALKQLGSPSILINNATYSTVTDIKNIASVELDKHYSVNRKAPILLTKKFIGHYDNNKHGRIINITSGQSLSAMSSEIAYALTKGAIAGLILFRKIL